MQMLSIVLFLSLQKEKDKRPVKASMISSKRDEAPDRQKGIRGDSVSPIL